MQQSTLAYLQRTGRSWARHLKADRRGRNPGVHRAIVPHAAIDPYMVRGFLPRPNTDAIKAVRSRRAKRPARDIFKLFGGPRDLFRALQEAGFPRNSATVFKWSYPFPKGSGGVIPVSSRAAVLAAARHRGIKLSAADLEEA